MNRLIPVRKPSEYVKVDEEGRKGRKGDRQKKEKEGGQGRGTGKKMEKKLKKVLTNPFKFTIL
jgi:hypothetical protein